MFIGIHQINREKILRHRIVDACLDQTQAFQRLLHRRLVTDVCQHDLIVEIQVSLQEHRLNFFLQSINSLLFLRRYRDHFLPARFAKRFFCENRFQICLI